MLKTSYVQWGSTLSTIIQRCVRHGPFTQEPSKMKMNNIQRQIKNFTSSKHSKRSCIKIKTTTIKTDTSKKFYFFPRMILWNNKFFQKKVFLAHLLCRCLRCMTNLLDKLALTLIGLCVLRTQWLVQLISARHHGSLGEKDIPVGLGCQERVYGKMGPWEIS